MQTIHEKPDDLHPVMETFGRSSLGKIIAKAKHLLALDRAMQTILPPEFVNYCRVINTQQFTLILEVNNASMAMRIQMMTDQLLSELQKKPEFLEIRALRCKIRV